MSDLQAHYLAAVGQHRAGRLAEAEAGYRRVLALDPGHADSLNLLGVVAAQCGHAEAAIEMIGRAIRLNDSVAGYHINLGLAWQYCGRREQAAECYRRALDLAPGDADAHNNLGILLQDEGRFDPAAEQFELSLAARPDHAEALVNLALARRNQGRLEDAVACGERALALRPGSAEACNNLALALDNLGRVEAALAHYRQALALRPDYPEALNNFGLALRQADQPEAALAQFDRALALRPDYAEAQLNQAMIRLLTGALRPGWAQYEWRWRSRQLEGERRDWGVPRWDGSDGAGRRILVWAEQGLGDSLQFCRYVPLLARRGWRVAAAVQPPLLRLFRSLDGAEEVVATGAEAGSGIDCHCPMMSLPHLFDTVLETVPAALPYLAPEAADVARWGRRLAASGFGREGGMRVGLVWAGNPRRHSPLLAITDARRSIALDQLAPLLAIPGIRFVSLQKDRRPGEVPAAQGILDLMDEVEDFADTAALVAHLDLVIAVDTSTLHLAGAMAKPVWLLNRYDTCWRWLRDRRDSPWYPTLRQFRQAEPGVWAGVLEAVAAALRQLAAGADVS
jgi:tetratricopeptide (TPR) repeat protein